MQLAVVVAVVCFVSPFVKLSCEDVAALLPLVYTSSNESPDECCGDTAGLGSPTQMLARIHSIQLFRGLLPLNM